MRGNMSAATLSHTLRPLTDEEDQVILCCSWVGLKLGRGTAHLVLGSLSFDLVEGASIVVQNRLAAR